MNKFFLKYFQQKALSIIEVIVAVFIAAIGLAGIAKVYYILNTNITHLDGELYAINLAADKVEYFRNYDSVSSGTDAYNNIVSGSETNIIKNITYTTRWTVTTFSNPAYKLINISVNWTEKDNSNQSTSMQTIIAKFNPESSGDLYQSETSGHTVSRP